MILVYKIVTGHFKYGLHNFFRKNPRYITFLRTSIRSSYISLSLYKVVIVASIYILRDIADALSLEEFYSKNVRLQNLQTHYIAGYFASEMHYRFPWLFSSKMLLECACANLRRYYIAYGLQERFDDSIKYFMSILTGKKRLCGPKKSTSNRPAVSDLESHVKESLKNSQTRY